MRYPRPTTTSWSSRTASRACRARAARPFDTSRRRSTAMRSSRRPGTDGARSSASPATTPDRSPSSNCPHARLVVDGVAPPHRRSDGAAGYRARVLLREPRRGDRRDADPSARPDLRVSLSAAARGGHAARGARPRRPHRRATCSPTSCAHEVADGDRIVAQTESFTAFVPFAARWPVEVHIYPNRFVHNLVELTDAELDDFARIYLDMLGRFDRMYSALAALHFGAASVRRHRRAARGLLPRRADVDSAKRHQAEVSGRIRIGDGRVHQRRHPRKRRPATTGGVGDGMSLRSTGQDQPDR